ncbi:MAG TPA: mechanosensitive ion channel family protein [Rhodanobacteraceae bacterium]|nr:mechanosensitive ion channel family protein [Rhodanobacteraceae bacterium]
MTVIHWLSIHSLLGVSLWNWSLALAAAIIAYLIVALLLRLVARHLRHASQHGRRVTATRVIASALDQTQTRLLLLLFLLLAVHSIGLEGRIETWLGWACYAVGGLQLGLWLSTAVSVWSGARLGAGRTGHVSPIVLSMLAWFARILIWATIVLVVLGNMGMNVTAFIASLGIGGVAVALGLQNVLKDLFASLAIGLDKPFEIGDFLIFGDSMGTVTRVGVKTTRIRTLHGEELSIGNANLLDQTIHNYGRIATRRMVVNFGIAIDTPREKVAQVAGLVREIIEATKGVNFDRSNFIGIGSSSFDFEAVYVCQDPDNNKSLDTQEAINLALLERLEALEVHLAVPAHIQYNVPSLAPAPARAPAREQGIENRE